MRLKLFVMFVGQQLRQVKGCSSSVVAALIEAFRGDGPFRKFAATPCGLIAALKSLPEKQAKVCMNNEIVSLMSIIHVNMLILHGFIVYFF